MSILSGSSIASMRLRTMVALVAASLFAAACSGSDDPGSTTSSAPASTVAEASDPSGSVATSGAPGSTTTGAPETGVPSVTTTTVAPSLDPAVLTWLLRDSGVASYQGIFETVVAWEGAGAVGVLGESAGQGSVTARMEGRQRVLSLQAADALYELVEEFTPAAGEVVVVREGVEDRSSPDRVGLAGFVPAPVSHLVSPSGFPVGGALGDVRGIPGGDNVPRDMLDTAALIGPPLDPGAVDVGSSWVSDADGGSFGVSRLTAMVVDEVASASGELAFSITFTGSMEGPIEVAPTVGLAALQAAAPIPMSGGDPTLLTGATATIRTRELEGSALIEPRSGSIEQLTSSLRVVVEFASADGVFDPFTVETRIIREFTLDGRSTATVFDRESILSAFALSAHEVAATSLDSIPGLVAIDEDDEAVSAVVDGLASIREDLLAGVAYGRIEDDEGRSAVVVSVATGGEFRGAPFLAEELAAFLSVSRPTTVRFGADRAYRVTIDGSEWLFYGNQDHLYIAVGARSPSNAAMSTLAELPDPYRWQTGDCLDFTDEFFSDTPYAPFGLHGLKHCGAPHHYEIIHAELVAEGASARYPSNLSNRSEQVCAGAFVSFTGGRTELESSLSLIRYLPDEQEWAQGRRYLACMVSVLNRGGEADQLIGRIDGSANEYAIDLAVGSCLDGLVPVECAVGHDREIIASFDLEGADGDPRPGTQQLQSQITADCDAAFDAFEFGEGPGTLRVFELTDVFTFWDAGARTYYCTVVAFGPDGFPLRIAGSFASGWDEGTGGVTA